MRLVTMALAVLLAAGVARAAPLEAYGKLPTMDMAAISPEGTKVAFVRPVDGKPVVFVYQLNPISLIAKTPSTPQKIRELTWADENDLLVTLSDEGRAFNVRREWFYLLDVQLQTHKIKQLIGTGKETDIRALTGPAEVRVRAGHTVVFAPSYELVYDQKRKDGSRVGVPALRAEDLVGEYEAIEMVAPAPQYRMHWVIDDDGSVIAQTFFDESTRRWGLSVHRDTGWVPIYGEQVASEMPEVIGLTPDGRSLVMQVYAEGRGFQFAPLSLADGKFGASNAAFGGFTGLVHDPWTDRLIGGRKSGIEPAYGFIDPKDQAAWTAAVKLFPDEYVDFVGWSRDRGKVLVRVTGVEHGVGYAVVDTSAGKATLLGQRYEGIGPSDFADVRIATYPAADGTQIKALLTLPNGRDPKNLPLIVLPHGGPADHDETGFDWMAQALASRGYAVLQPQFRGSSGFGWKLESAGFGEWGRKMQSDLSDGVRALANQGFIDPKRVCIVGASYGGYAALAGVTIEQGVYRCAVSVAGPSDLRTFIGGPKADPDHSSTVRYWDRFMGAKDPKDPILDVISPAKHAAQASAPVLLIHGKEDTVVPFEQSQIMERALRGAGKPVEFVTLKAEDHWLSREATRAQMLQATVAFVEKNNPPK